MPVGDAEEALPRLVLRLPGAWSQIPLDDRERARAAIRELVRRQVGVADDRAILRDELARHLLASLEESIAGEGQSFHVALQIVPKLPIPVSIAVSLPDQAVTPAVGTAPSAVMAVLAQGLEQTQAESWPTAKRFQTKESEVLRLHRRVPVEGKRGEEPLDSLVADYWMTIPGTKRFALVTCATALGPLEDTMLGFFDSLVRVSRWEAPVANA